jgi:hypothetical protein
VSGLLLASAMPAAAAGDLSVQLYPKQPLIESTRFGNAVNFDFEFINKGRRTLELTAVRAFILDSTGAVAQRLEVNDNGSLPGIATIANRIWKPGEARTIFNPFHTLAADVPLARMRLEFEFKDEAKAVEVFRAEVVPKPYVQKTRLILPMPGRVLVWDGHDFYSHHRRWDFSHVTIKRLGLLSNAGRYSLDLVIANASGQFYTGDGVKREDYFSYGTPVVAPGDGIVVASAGNSSNEPTNPTMESFRRDPMFTIYGNYVVIDHGNGEFSQLGHLKQGSVTVRQGEKVRQGQKIGEAGASGTSLFPHLHYQLVDRPGIDAEGLPARFDGVVRLLGSTRKAANDGWIDSGDLVESVRR